MPLSQGDDWSCKDDAELVIAASKGNDKAFRELLERYRTKILAICMRMVKNKTEAEEAAQDSFVKIYFHLKDFDMARNFSVWAGSIAVNECRDRLRRRSRYSRTFRDIEEIDSASNPTIMAADCDDQENLKQVEAALEELPEKLKEVIVLKAYSDYSYDEIAAILKIRIGTVMSRLFRARQKLSEILGTSRSRLGKVNRAD